MPDTSPPAKMTPPDDALYVRWSEWSGLKTNLAWIYEGEISGPNRRGNWHPDHMAAWLVKRGSVTLRQEGKITTAGAGEWMVPWPGYRYQEFSDDAVILSVRFQAAWPDGKPLFERGLSVKFPAARFPRLEIVARQLLEAARPVIPGDPVQLSTASIPFDNFLEVKAVTLRWLSEIYNTLCALGLRPSRLGICDERIVSALQRLDRLALSQKLVEGRLASEFGLSVSQFARLFRQELGETPKHYFDQRRLYYCRQMLAGTAVPIKEIAYNLGFTRLSDFSTWFRKHYRISPRLFREEAHDRDPV
jgi:AraC-like DNA-binding protein